MMLPRHHMNEDNSGSPAQFNLTSFGLDTNSPLNPDNRPQMSGMQFDMQHEVQRGKMRYSSLVGTSKLATASGNITSGGVSVVTTTLTPNIKQNMNFAIPYIAVYEGVGVDPNFQIYPVTGGSITGGKFQCISGFDYNSWTGLTTFPGPSVYKVSIYNSAGTTANVYVQTQWKFTANNTGGQT